MFIASPRIAGETEEFSAGAPGLRAVLPAHHTVTERVAKVEDEASQLAELLCARLCHDLAGTIGAVGTGAELLAEENSSGNLSAAGVSGDALALLLASAATLSARLRFLRLALGNGKGMTGEQLRQLVADFLAGAASGGGWRLAWQDDGPVPWSPAAGKLLVNLVWLAQDCLPRGGTIAVEARRQPQILARVTADGPLVSFGEAATGLTATAIGGLGPRSAQGLYAARLAQRQGYVIRSENCANRISFVAEKCNLYGKDGL